MQLDWMDLVKGGIERLTEPLGKLFMTRNMKGLFDEALRRNITLYPVANSKDLLENEQLKSREFWVNLEHRELADTITYPGPFAVLSETPVKIGRRAPLIGEHNQEIYQGELGLGLSELQTLSQKGII